MEGDEAEYLQPVFLSSDAIASLRFKPLLTIWAAGFLLILTVSLEVIVVTLTLAWPEETLDHCEPLYLLLYAHVALWFIYLIIDHYHRWKHYRLRLAGYLEFYEVATSYATRPCLIVSLWNGILLIATAVFHERHVVLEPFCDKTELWSPVHITCLIITFEMCFLVPVLLMYIIRVRRFNKERPRPDVERMSCPDSSDIPSRELGYRDREVCIEELLFKQAELIRHYRDANRTLSRRIMSLTAQLRGDAIN